MTGRLLLGRTRHHIALNTQHHDAFCFAQDWHRHRNGSGNFGATVPMNNNCLGKRLWGKWWRHQDGPTAFEEYALNSGHTSSSSAGAIEHGQVVDTSKTSQ